MTPHEIAQGIWKQISGSDAANGPAVKLIEQAIASERDAARAVAKGLKEVLLLIEEKYFCRDTSRDGESDFVLKALDAMYQLKTAQESLAAYKAATGEGGE